MEGVIEIQDPAFNQLRRRALRQLLPLMRRTTILQEPVAQVGFAQVNCTSGVDKRCRIDLRVEQARTVTVLAVAREWRSALDTAVLRARRLLLNDWKRVPIKPARRTAKAGRRAQPPLLSRLGAPVGRSLR